MTATFDVERIREDFPILKRDIRGKRLVYLDSGASAQKPRQVIDCVKEVYEGEYANVHRGLHYLSERATARYEGTRETIRRFIGARHTHEIILTRGTTDGINLVAGSYGRTFLKAGDEVLVTHAEHHSNIVPWQMLRQEKGIVLKVVPVDEDGSIHFADFERLITERTKIVSITHVSNVLGTVLPLKQIARLAHERGAVLLVDGAQGVVHIPLDMQDLDVDFYAFSGHKLYGPTGIGVLYGKEELLEQMPPYQGGGDMINSVSFEETT